MSRFAGVKESPQGDEWESAGEILSEAEGSRLVRKGGLELEAVWRREHSGSRQPKS